ncbi:MAG TPA: tetratricopeptide repeat protein [Blastocatellia bacterium]|nr:tetratricopeptide repeat protein [Blastocatellia bacterium]
MGVFSNITLIAFMLFASPYAPAQSARGQADTKSAAAAFEEGQNAQQRGDLNSAVRLYTSALASDPALYQAYYQRATALIALGRDKEAEPDLKKVIELKPDFARAHRALGNILLDRGMTDEAKRELGRAIELDPKLTGVRIFYASALIKSGENQKAIETLRQAIELGEASALAFALIGVAEERAGKAEEAFADYSRAIVMDTTIATAREGRARLHEARGDIAKAIEDYTAAYRAQPSQDVALRLANLHLRAGQPQAALQVYRLLMNERPNDFELRAEAARLMNEIGQSEAAIKEITALASARPGDVKILVAAGDIYFKDNPEQAAGYYRKAIEIEAGNNNARVQLGASLVRAMQFEAALPVLADAIAREENNYAAHANLATALFKLQRYPESAREFIWLIRAKPEVTASYYFLAISFDHLGDCQQALRAYQEFARRADRAASKTELEDANIRMSLLEKLAKSGKCKTAVKGKGK